MVVVAVVLSNSPHPEKCILLFHVVILPIQFLCSPNQFQDSREFFSFLAVSPPSIVTKCSVIHLSESHRDSDFSCRRLPDCHLTKHFENNGVFCNRQCGNKDQAEGKLKRRGVGENQQQFNFCAEQ